MLDTMILRRVKERRRRIECSYGGSFAKWETLIFAIKTTSVSPEAPSPEHHQSFGGLWGPVHRDSAQGPALSSFPLCKKSYAERTLAYGSQGVVLSKGYPQPAIFVTNSELEQVLPLVATVFTHLGWFLCPAYWSHQWASPASLINGPLG